MKNSIKKYCISRIRNEMKSIQYYINHSKNPNTNTSLLNTLSNNQF